jgi:hypothetical protein
MIARIALAGLLLAPAGALAEADLPAWVGSGATLVKDAGGARSFVSTGLSGELGPAEVRGEGAEDAARQAMGGLVAEWQDRVLACAGRERLSEVKARTRAATGALLSLELETSTSVSLYRARVAERAYVGRRIAVLLRHDLESMIAGIRADGERPASLREAVKACGEQAFDALVRSKAGSVAPVRSRDAASGTSTWNR